MSTAASPTVAARSGPTPRLTHRQVITILIGLMLGMFLAALDQTIVSAAMRTIADKLNAQSSQAWATTAYLITSTISTPLYGKLSDIYGRKKFFTAAIAIFTIGSMLCTLSWDIGSLAAFRALQGLGAGGLFSLALAIVGDIVPPRERAKYQGYFLAVFGTSSVLGPVIGGIFADRESILGVDGWRWVFLVNVPIAIVALVVVHRTLHLKHTRLDHRIDYMGAVALVVGVVPLLIVAEQGREWGWTSASALACYAIGALGLVAGFFIEKRMGDEALVPLRLFTNRTVRTASIASVFIGMGMFGALASIPLYLQIVRGASPMEAGLQMLPLTLGIMTGSIVSGQLISRTGRYRRFPIMGSAILVVSFLLFHTVHFDTPIGVTMAYMVLTGIGLGFNFQPLTLAVQSAVPRKDIGVATASATFTRQMGGTLGTAVLLSVLFSAAADRIASAMRSSVGTPEYQAAMAHPTGDAAANATFLQGLKSGHGTGGALQDTSFLQQIDPRLAQPFLRGFAEAMDAVFLVAAILVACAFIASCFLPHVDLGEDPRAAAKAAEDAPTAPFEDAEVVPDEPTAGEDVTDADVPDLGDEREPAPARQ